MKDSKVIIRNLKPSEFDSLVEIWNEASLPFKPKGRDTKANVQGQLEIKNNRFLVALIDEKPVGVVIASHNGRKGWINRLAVLPEFRNQGIASSLIAKAEEFFTSSNIQIFACLIEDWNQNSMNFIQGKDYVKHQDIVYFTKKLGPDV